MNNINIGSSILKVVVGQAIESISPKMGFGYHLLTTATATNEVDFGLGMLGLGKSASKI